MNAELRPRESLDFLLILRAFAGLVVVVHHVFAIVPQAAWGTLLIIGPLNVTFLLEGCGQVGVGLFFCLSGYLMAKGFYRKRYGASRDGALAFYQNRFLRIVPLYAFYIVIASTLAITHADSPDTFHMSLLRLATFTYNSSFANGNSVLLSHLWSISTEVQFYLIVPFIMFAVCYVRPSRFQALAGLGALLIGGTVVRALVWRALGADYGQWSVKMYEPLHMNIDLFVAGMLLNFVPSRPCKHIQARHAVAYVGSIVSFYCVAAYATYEGLTMHASDTAINLFVVGMPSLTLGFGLSMIYFGERIAFKGARPVWCHGVGFPALKACEFVGKITFGVYLWHVAFIYRDWPYLNADSPLQLYGSVLLSSLALTLLTATVTHYGIELTSDKLKARTGPAYRSKHDVRHA